VTGFVFVTGLAADIKVDASASVAVGDESVLSDGGRGGCLGPDLYDSSSVGRMRDVRAERYVRVDSDNATTSLVDSLLAAVRVVVCLLFDNTHRCCSGLATSK
jgi:hypothetical protein